MPVRLAINGFGRMGRLVLRVLTDRFPDLQVVAINDCEADAACAAHLLTFDSIHGRWDRDIRSEANTLWLGGRAVRYSQVDTLEALPWRDLDVQLALECTGAFKSEAALAPYVDLGVRKVLVACPVKGGALNVVYGVNHGSYDPQVHRIVTAASCTTNSLAPVIKVLQEAVGIRHGAITTIHDVTNTQRIVDAPHKDLRRARACGLSLIPTSTGSATAITAIYPELTGRLNAIAVRVPMLNASLTDCVFEMQRPVTVAEVNALFQAAAAGPLAGILGYEERPLVSVDYKDDPRSGVVDALSTMVVDGTCLKVLIWYDNETGYVNRMAELAAYMAPSL